MSSAEHKSEVSRKKRDPAKRCVSEPAKTQPSAGVAVLEAGRPRGQASAAKPFCRLQRVFMFHRTRSGPNTGSLEAASPSAERGSPPPPLHSAGGIRIPDPSPSGPRLPSLGPDGPAERARLSHESARARGSSDANADADA
ncbi:unnamed protein product, partial [Protopolystoma xenopodis]